MITDRPTAIVRTKYKYRRESGLAHVDFVGEPAASPIQRRAASGKGVHGVKIFDFAREKGDEVVPDIEAGVYPDAVSDEEYTTCSKSKATSRIQIDRWQYLFVHAACYIFYIL